jgi:hypothetical protein
MVLAVKVPIAADCFKQITSSCLAPTVTRNDRARYASAKNSLTEETASPSFRTEEASALVPRTSSTEDVICIYENTEEE